MSIKVRKKGDELGKAKTYQGVSQIREAVANGDLTGRDEYYAPQDNEWVELDAHREFSTTDARGTYPAFIHAVVVVKIIIFITFMAILQGDPADMTKPIAFYFYALLVGDVVGIILVYRERTRFASVLFWILGILSFPLGLFLILCGKMTWKYRHRPAE